MEYTREDFLKQVKRIAKYWGKVGADKADAADGVAFSILCMIDGVSGDCPMLKVINADTGKEITNWNELHSEFARME